MGEAGKSKIFGPVVGFNISTYLAGKDSTIHLLLFVLIHLLSAYPTALWSYPLLRTECIILHCKMSSRTGQVHTFSAC